MHEKKIFLIEDEGLICDLVEDFVQLVENVQFCGFCQAGNEAMAQIRKHRPDIVILDIRLPGESGLDLLPQIRSELPEAKIILFTGSLKQSIVSVAVENQVNGYVEKIYGFEELVHAIEAVLHEQGYTTPGVAKYCVTTSVLQEYLCGADQKAV